MSDCLSESRYCREEADHGMSTKRRRRAQTRTPAVLVTVSGGHAYACASRGVRVVVVDWDNLDADDALQAYSTDDIQAINDDVETLPRSILKQAPEVLPDLRKEIDRWEQLKQFVPPGARIPVRRCNDSPRM
jgi:hypothetical protein